MWEKSFPKSPENVRIFDLGMQAYDMGDFKGAVEIFKRIIEREPDVSFAWYNLLGSLSYLAKWEEMIVIGEKAIKLHPNFGPIYSWLGDAYKQLGSREQALVSYNKALNLLEKELNLLHKKQERKSIFDSPYIEQTLLNSLGEIYNRLGNYEEAIQYNQKSSNIHSDQHNLHGLGTSYMEMGEYDKAIEFYKKSLDIDPKHSYAWFDLGLVYENLNDYKKAIDCFENAVENSPQWVKLREKLLNVKPDSPALLKKSPDIMILTTLELDLQKTKTDAILNNPQLFNLKDNKLSVEERKNFEHFKLVRNIIKEIEDSEESIEDKLLRLKKCHEKLTLLEVLSTIVLTPEISQFFKPELEEWLKNKNNKIF